MPDFDRIHSHARMLAALTDPDRPGQRRVVTWPIEVAEHWEALVKLWSDPAEDQHNGIDLAAITPAHIEQLEDTYSSNALDDLKNAVALYHQRHRPEGSQVEHRSPINIDARHSVIHHQQQEARKPRRATCGNCGERYEITEDPTENHHRAMIHKQTCKKRAAAAEDHARLVEEFARQDMPRLFRQRAEQMLAAGVDPVFLSATGVNIFAPAPAPRELRPAAEKNEVRNRRQWWEFWRWFR